MGLSHSTPAAPSIAASSTAFTSIRSSVSRPAFVSSTASFSESLSIAVPALTSSAASLSLDPLISASALVSSPAFSPIEFTTSSISSSLATATAATIAAASPLAASEAASAISKSTAASVISSSTTASVISSSTTSISSLAGAAAPTALGVAAGVAAGPVAVITQPKVGPFSPTTAILGTVPTIKLDVPITAVFLVLFVAGAATHFIRHELNSKRGHKFHLSDMIFDFCMVRNITCIMRIVWATKPKNNSIIVAAEIFENAGVVVLFAVNVILTQRVLRAIHPNFGWNPIVSKFFIAILVSVPSIIVWNIVNLTVSFFTLNEKALRNTHDLLLFGGCWTTFLSLFPIIFLVPATIIPCKGKVEKFGTGRFRTKIIFLVFVSSALAVGTITRLIAAVDIFPFDKPGTIDSKKTFYTTGFMLEIIVVYMYHIVRFDLRFHIPDGSSGPGDYSGKNKLLADAAKMGEDDASNFQDVDVKMRMSIANLPSDDGIPESQRSTPEQVRQAIRNLRQQSEIVGQPIDSGDSELLIYAFRVKRPEYGDKQPQTLYARNSMEMNGYPDEKGDVESYNENGVPNYYNPSFQNGLPRNPRPPPRNSAWKRASRGYWNMRQSLV